jgi:hypothetical protein
MQNRRTLFTAAGSGALAALLSSTRRTIAQATDATAAPPTSLKTLPTDPFILLLHGVYVPITNGPNLGLSGINLMDGTYSRTRIYAVFGVPDPEGEDERETNKVPTKPIGNFYVQFNGSLCAYELPGGAIAMQFLDPPKGAPPGYNAFITPGPSDGKGGSFLQGTFELNITDATGIYEQFKGGHNHMVDRLHQLASGKLDEFCFCNISQYPFPAAPSS